MKAEDILLSLKTEREYLALLSSQRVASSVRLNIFKTTMDSVVSNGSATRKLTEKIEHEIQSQVEIEKKIVESTAKLSAYEELVKIFPKQQNFKLREGSEIANVEKFIRSAGRPLSLDEIVKKLAETDDELKTSESILEKKKSLRSTLRVYVRDCKVFTEGQEPGTYTLISAKCLELPEAKT